MDELDRIIDCVEMNPVKAGLAVAPEEWLFSSAYDRAARKCDREVPLTRLFPPL
jgi:hypothetical protein